MAFTGEYLTFSQAWDRWDFLKRQEELREQEALEMQQQQRQEELRRQQELQRREELRSQELIMRNQEPEPQQERRAHGVWKTDDELRRLEELSNQRGRNMEHNLKNESIISVTTSENCSAVKQNNNTESVSELGAEQMRSPPRLQSRFGLSSTKVPSTTASDCRQKPKLLVKLKVPSWTTASTCPPHKPKPLIQLKNTISQRVQEARPIQPGDYDNTYQLAHHDIPTTMAHCGFRCYRNCFRFLLSPFFLRAFINFADVVQNRTQKGVAAFKSLIVLIAAHCDKGSDYSFASCLKAATTQYLQGMETDSEEAKVKAANTFHLWRVIENAPGLLKKSYIDLEVRRERQYASMIRQLGTVPVIGLLKPIFVPQSSKGRIFVHDNDMSDAEHYHRVWQLMLMLWDAVWMMEEGTIYQEKWKKFWQQDILFSNEKVDPKQYAPSWMRATKIAN